MGGIQLRWAQARDAATLSAMNEDFNGCRREPAKIQQALAQAGELVAVAEKDGQLLGFACAQCLSSFCYDHPEAQITELYVQPNYRRRGVAAMLMGFLEGGLWERGVREVRLSTGTHNSAARALYLRLGYRLEDDVAFARTLGRKGKL